MKKGFLIFIMCSILTSVLFIVGCNKTVSNNDDLETKNTQIVESKTYDNKETKIVESKINDNKETESATKQIYKKYKYFTYEEFTKDGEPWYKYYVYNKDGKKFFEGEVPVYHYDFKKLEKNIYYAYVGIGTGVYRCQYFDVANSKVSKVFDSPWEIGYRKVARVKLPNTLIIEDIFDDDYHKEISLNDANGLFPLRKAKLLDENHLKIKYATGKDYIEKTVIFELDNWYFIETALLQLKDWSNKKGYAWASMKIYEWIYGGKKYITPARQYPTGDGCILYSTPMIRSARWKENIYAWFNYKI